jgi:uncharacterized MAPEG superfamily protein
MRAAMSPLATVVDVLADLVVIAAHIFVICTLMFAASLVAGAAVARPIKWLNSQRLRVDFGPNKSRGWTNP